jgi:hypothetical protein
MSLSQEPWVGVKGEFEAMCRLLHNPGCGLFGDVRGMIVEDQLDRRVDRICGIEELEEFDEFAAAMTVSDEGMNLAADKGRCRPASSPCAVAFIIKFACEGGMHAGLGGGGSSPNESSVGRQIVANSGGFTGPVQ